MMKIFMSNPKSYITSDYFMEKIWGMDSGEERDVVWVYVSFLRKKLEALHASIYIDADGRGGYKLAALVPGEA